MLMLIYTNMQLLSETKMIKNKKTAKKLSTRLSIVVLSLLFLLTGLLPLTITNPQSAHAATLPAYRYTKTFDTSAAGASAYATGVATDSSGNIYVTGQFSGTVVFDGVGGSDSKTSTNQSSFLTKYNANGSYAYTKIFDTSAAGASAYANSVATDSSGNIYETGSFTGTVVFDGVGGSDSRTSTNQSSFLTKYNANGSYAYTKIFDTSAAGAQAYAAGVATDSSGNVYETGYFIGTVVFDGVGGSDSKTSTNQSSFLTKYNANGSYAYTKIFDTSAAGASAQGAGVATDSSGNVYETGYFIGTVVFDGVGGSDSQTSTNGSSFLIKYNANGTYGYTKIFDTSAASASAQGYGVATDSSGNVYVTGDFGGTVVFDGVGGSDSQTSTNGSSFLTKYNANGSYAYTKIFDTSANGAGVNGYSVATDSSGNVYETGSFIGTVVFDGVGGSYSQTAGGSNYDAYLTRYNANGSYGWTKTFDTTNGDIDPEVGSVATDIQGNAYITSAFIGTVVFDGVGGSDSYCR